jgi:hypothetical protein
MGKVDPAERKPATALSAVPDPDPEPTEDPGPTATSTTVGPAIDSADADWFGDLDEETDFLKILYYGREGVGKTSAAAHAANYGRILVINAESGVKKKPLRDRLGINVENIKTWPPQNSKVQISNDTLLALHDKILLDLRNDPKSWFAVVFDSITEIHQKLREQATDKRVRKVAGTDPDWIDRDDYGVMTSQMRKLVRRYRDLPTHVIFTALEVEDEKANTIRPAVTPALCNDLLGYVDVVARMGSPVGDYRARTLGTERIRAKDRFSHLPPVMIEPSFTRVLDYLDGKLEEPTDPIQEIFLAEQKAKEEAALEEAVAPE